MATSTAPRKSRSLSKASTYEQTFGTRYRRPGRPERDDEPLFPGGDLDPLIQKTAQRRAIAVVLEEQRDRLRDLFAAEARVLRRRGVEEVADDLGIDLTEPAAR